MSQQNLEIAARFAEAVNAREVPSDLVTVDTVIENVATAVTDHVYRGPDGAAKWMQDLFEAFDEDARFEQEVIAAGEDYVVGRLRISGRGSASGAPLDLRWIGVLWTDGRRITRAVGYGSRREAFEALGIAEPR